MMEIHKINFEEVRPFTKRDIKYRNHPESFSEFYRFQPNLEGFAQAIAERNRFPVDRELLQTVIKKQYEGYVLSELQENHIKAIVSEQTFTVVTAHQPSLLTGPLYYIYKIFSAINLAEKLKANFPTYHFVPVFITGSEDHDFAEINHLHLFQHKIEWQHEAGGPVGRLNTNGLKEVISEVKSLFSSSAYGSELSEILDKSLDEVQDYNSFVFKLINQLFGQYGLLLLNMDDVQLKGRFKPVMKKELTEHPSAELIKQSQERWQALGYHSQAHAREINLFYMDDGIRERIVKSGDYYEVNNTELRFSQEEILKLLDEHPDKFSPNVVIRPLYEEYILPNLAYIGGGGELAYWLERKTQFEHFGIFYPILVRRDSMLWISKAQLQTLQKNEMVWQDLFLDEDALINKYIQHTLNYDISLEEETGSISQIFQLIASKAAGADKTLESFVEAERVKIVKSVEHIEQRIKRAIKKNEETAVNQLKNLKNKLFPGGGLQERHDNFMQYYLTLGPSFFETIKKEADPLQNGFTVIIQN